MKKFLKFSYYGFGRKIKEIIVDANDTFNIELFTAEAKAKRQKLVIDDYKGGMYEEIKNYY